MELFTWLRKCHQCAVLGIALVALLTLSACGSSGSSTGGATVPGVTNDTITIGGVLDTTGAIKVICAPILAGDQLYFDKVNAAGGINGRKIKFIQVSDDGNSTKTKDAVRQLVEQDNVFAIFQVCGSGAANVAESYLGPKGIPFVDPIGGGAKFTDAQGQALPWLWMTQPNYGDEGHVIGYYLTQKLQAKKVGLLYEDDVLGLQQKTALGESLQKYSGSLIASVGYSATQTDFTAAVQTLKAANPDIIVLNGLPGPTAKFVAAATGQGYRPHLGYLATIPWRITHGPGCLVPRGKASMSAAIRVRLRRWRRPTCKLPPVTRCSAPTNFTDISMPSCLSTHFRKLARISPATACARPSIMTSSTMTRVLVQPLPGRQSSTGG